MPRYATLALLGVVLAVSAAHAQEIRTVILLSDDKALVDTAVVATKNIATRLASSGQSKGPIVEVRSCPKVSADNVQAVLKELQAKNYIVALDLKEPEPHLCAR